ncbi:MAG: hypothetical protein COT74_03745 [Bdellovibrionales bacterium CG10_big_fil_rev_8_21_14_0_10_45_34]|nr:MAG: hypothetical protein COT74_03745 [Bdellovibrionales bacterium CG10_big_fil_rev_8_21_14_0_10_45_34]
MYFDELRSEGSHSLAAQLSARPIVDSLISSKGPSSHGIGRRGAAIGLLSGLLSLKGQSSMKIFQGGRASW